MSRNLSEVSSGDAQFVDRDLFRDVIGHFASGVTIVTSRHDDTDFGITASAVASLTLDPPMLLVCVNRETGTRNAITESGVFAVNILYEEQGELAVRFARPDTDKFRDVETVDGELGEPLLRDVLAHLECRVAQEVTAGTHSVFLAEVQSAHASTGTPLTYFRGAFGRFQEANDENVYLQLRKSVLEREFQREQALDITDLAYQLDAPRQAIYYAMTRLVSEGLVSRDDEATYTVTSLDSATYDQAMDTRCALELGAAESAVGHVSEEELAELRMRMEATMLPEDGQEVSAEEYVESNTAFHDHTVAIAKNSTLLSSYRRLTAEAVTSRALQASLQANDTFVSELLGELAEDHRRMTRGYEAGDLQEVKSAIRQHAEGAKRLGHHLIEGVGGRI